MKKTIIVFLIAFLTMTISANVLQGKKHFNVSDAAKKELVGQKRHVINAPQVQLNAPMQAKAPKADAEVVTPPTTLETEKYRLNGYLFDGSSWQLVSNPLQIGMDGNDVYVQGFSILLPEAWIKGTLDSEAMTVTFPAQYYGNYQGYEDYFFPVTPVGSEGYNPIDAVFNYNDELGTFILSQDVVCNIFENSSLDELSWYYQFDSEMTITPDGNTVVVPEDLETVDYALTGVYMGYEDDWFEGDPLSGSAKIGIDGDDIYIQGLCSYLPLAWVKGHREGDNYVFDNGQFFGTFIYSGDAYPLYFMGCEPQTNDAAQLVLTFDPETGIYTAQKWYAISSSPDEVWWYDLLGNVQLSPIFDEPATPATPSVLYLENYADEGFGYAMLDIPVADVDGNPLLADKLGYQLFCDYGNGAEPYVFLADYYGFDEDQTTIPYTFGDDINFLPYGQLVVVYELGEDLQRIGVRSVYEGGGETNYSEIGWFDVQDTGITTVTANDTQATEYYDLMGRRVNANNLRPGIYVTNTGKKILIK